MNATRIASTLAVLAAALAVVACERADASRKTAADTAPLVRSEALEHRRMWTGGDGSFYSATVSPDGRYVTNIDWDTGDLSVIDLETGTERRVTDKGPWSKSGDYAEFSVFSPDGRRIAYSWFSQQARGYEVRTINRDGSDMRTVFPRREDVAYVAVEDWSRDGKAIAVTVARRDRTVQIGLVSPDDSGYRALKTNDWRHPTVAAISPDGKYLAYDLARSATETNRDVFLLALDGSREVQLTRGEDDHALMGWLPDGRGILYRTAGAATGLWALGIRDGQTTGEPQQVRAGNWPVTPLGVSRNALYYGVLVEQPQPHVVGVDLDSGRVVSAPTRMGDSAEGAGHHPVWSPDGQMIAYLRGERPRLVLRSVTGELRREIAVPLTDPRKTQWTSDGSAVLMYGTDAEGRVGIHRVDLQSGRTSPVLTYGPGGEAEGAAFWALSPDGNTIYHRRPPRNETHMVFGPRAAARERAIVAHDLRTGETRDVLTVPSGRAISLSPDGQWLAYTTENLETREGQIMIAPTTGRPVPREVFRHKGGRSLGNRGSLEWTPDGKSLLVYYAPPEGPGGIWQVPLAGGERRLLLDDRHLTAATPDERRLPWDFRLSPDGRRITYQTGRSREEIWMMTGLDQ